MVLSVASEPTFQRERLADLLEEIGPLLVAHWQEVAPYQDIPVKPRIEHYLKVDDLGMLRCFTLRQDGKLIGYAIFFAVESLQSEGVKVAKHEVLYIAPEHRLGMRGMKLVHDCDQELRMEGITIVQHTVRPTCDYSEMLERLGYELTNTEYSRRLDWC